jgi:hypothetical protein
MANPTVDKLQDFAIRHGEKVVVGIAVTLFVVCLGLAVSRSVIDLTPDKLKSSAELASKTLQTRQDPAKILERIQGEFLKDVSFAKVVDDQKANALKASDFRAKFDYVIPEPGAGLIRDQPEIVKPTELAAFPGRGGMLLYALKDGERIVDNSEPAKAAARKSNRRSGGPRGGSGGGSSDMASQMARFGGGVPGGGASGPANDSEAAKREAERIKRGLVGKVDAPKEEKKADEPEPEAAGPWKEEVTGKRWVVITGVIDHEQMRKNWLTALKLEALAHPNYKRLDVQRQTYDPDTAEWSPWAKVDPNKNYDVLDNVPEYDAEYVPESMRLEALADKLPFLKAGYWTGVHVAKLVPPDILDSAKGSSKASGKGIGSGLGGPGSGGGAGSSDMASQMARMRGGSGMGGPGGMGMMGRSGGGVGPMGEGGSPGMSIGGGGGGDLSADETNFPKSEDKTIMLRSLDFTIEPNMTYRYRVRIVVVNPNLDHTDVNPGVDTESKELVGPWSDPTDRVSVPADVVAYAMSPMTNSRRDDLVSFEVIRWDPKTGQTVVKNDTRGPGQIVGEPGTVQVPSSEGSGPTSSSIDFTSRDLVLDAIGGPKRLPDIGVERNAYEIPTIAMVVEPDGSVAIRNQASDRGDAIREDMDKSYHQAIEDSGKKREPGGGGSRMPGFGGPGGGGRRGGRGGGAGKIGGS